MPTIAKREACYEWQLWLRVNGGQRAILTVWQLDLRPEPSVNKKLKLSLFKNWKGRADLENSERFTFIDDAKVVSLEKRVAVPTARALALVTGVTV